MAPNNVNNSLNVGTNNEHQDNFHGGDQQDDSTKNSHQWKLDNSGPRIAKYSADEEPNPDDMDDESVIEAVKVLRAQQREIMNHISRHDCIMTEL